MNPNTTPEAMHRKLESALAFTRAYQRHLSDPIAVREAMCLKEQYPALLQPIEDTDLIAGRLLYAPLVGFGLEFLGNRGMPALASDNKPHSELTAEEQSDRLNYGVSCCGFCCDHYSLQKMHDELPTDSSKRKEIADMMEFWRSENMRTKYNHALPQEIVSVIGRYENVESPRHINAFFRLCCVSLDYEKLLVLGLPGMRDLITAKINKTSDSAKSARDLYMGMLLALDVVENCCYHYKAQAQQQAGQTQSVQRRQQLITMVETLDSLTYQKPQTFRQAMQLFWLYNQLTDTVNWGRMDIFLGDFYARDIDNGTMTHQEGRELITSLWTIISQIKYRGGGTRPNARIIVGGKGRKSETNADRFALEAMEVTRLCKYAEPNLTLRFYKGQNPALMEKAYELLAEGCIHPSLYNDDVHIPMVKDAYNATLEDAEHYIPEGCGEIMLDHRCVGSPNNIFNYVSSLNLVLHRGVDPIVKSQMGLDQGAPNDFKTFDDLVAAFKKQVDYTNNILAWRHSIEHRIERENASFLFMSMLTDDCIGRGRSLYDGGTQYLGGIIETFGLTNVVDSLIAIKKFVFEQKAMSLQQLVDILDKNWEGHERERQILLRMPKFGNDIEEVDNLYKELDRFVCCSANEKASKYGLHFFLNCNLNVGGNFYATILPASPDGRVLGESMALGNAPTAGRDKNGLTALLNSMCKRSGPNSGYVQNLKVTKGLLSLENREKFKTMVDTYFDKGGCQIMVTALNKDDLENALKEPEKYPNLLVRVSGWTSKFVELPKQFQREILNRTLYGE